MNGIDKFRADTGIGGAQEVPLLAVEGDNMAKSAFAKVQAVRAKIVEEKRKAVTAIDEKYAEELAKAEGEYIFRVRLLSH
jgi:hypothetical protein